MKRFIKIGVTVGLMLMVFVFSACTEKDYSFEWEGGDAFSYLGEQYVSVDLSKGIFFNDVYLIAPDGSQDQEKDDTIVWQAVFDEEEDDDGESMYIAESGMGETLYYNGTFYCREECLDAVMAYYDDDENFDWSFETEHEEMSVIQPVSLTEEECDWIYGLEEMDKEKSVFLAEAEAQGSLVRCSRDGLICGRTSLLQYDGEWYWQSEIIDENREIDGDWPEYIQPLPESLSEKIDGAI